MEADSLERLTGVNWLAPRGKIGPGSDSTTADANGQFESTMLFKQNEYPSWKIWNLTALTQKWVKVSGPGSAPNYGVILWATRKGLAANEDTNSYDLRFRSSEYTDTTAHQPRLEVIWSTTPKTVYFLKDHLGSIRATVLDSATAPVIGYDDYDPWGYPLALRTKAIPNAYLQGASTNRFTGKEHDSEYGVNWDYFGARYYDAQIGRWMVRDPQAENALSWSPYNYTYNNPLKYTDPNGELPWGAVIGGLVEYGFQVAETGSWRPTAEGWARIGIAAGAGLASGGLSVVTKGVRGAQAINFLGNAAISASEGIAKSTVSGQEITVVTVATDVIIGSASSIGGAIGQEAAQSTTAGRELAAEANKLVNIANTGRFRPAQAARAEQAQAAVENFGSGAVATTIAGVATGIVGNVASSMTQTSGAASVTTNAVTTQQGVANPDNTRVVIKTINEEKKRE